jgi:dihydrofolate reductase
MRRVCMLNSVSIDGYFASNNEKTWGMDWFVPDPAVEASAHQLIHANTLILGEETYLGFERSWVPFLKDPEAPKEMKKVAQELTAINKVVFSKKLKETTWENTELHDGNLSLVVKELKSGEGPDILVLGSGTIVQQLTQEGLIDEYFFILTPVIAGQGKPLFPGVNQLGLTLMSAQSFDSGNLLLRYQKQ